MGFPVPESNQKISLLSIGWFRKNVAQKIKGDGEQGDGLPPGADDRKVSGVKRRLGEGHVG